MSMTSIAMAEGLYRVGDYVYMEIHGPREPYQICRLESITKTSTGVVEATVSRFLRHRDLPPSLISTAAKHIEAVEEESPDGGFRPSCLDPTKRHKLLHRELFLTRDFETYEVSLIRGRCLVTLLCEEENPNDYLNRLNMFFYSLVYDPAQRTLVEETGEIRIGSKYQAVIPDLLSEEEREKNNDITKSIEGQSMWMPERLPLAKVDQFMVLARSVGTFARAMISTRTQPSLCVSAVAASRDVTLFHAMTALHRASYDLSAAVSELVPSGGPLLCRDELENWTPDEVNAFEQALLKYGKDFTEIQKQALAWKSVKSIIEYYYMWKTTERYLRVKQQKQQEKCNQLKQIRISISSGGQSAARNLQNASSNALPGAGSAGGLASGHPNQMPRTVGQPSNANVWPQQRTLSSIDGRCEGCQATSSTRWHPWGSPDTRLQLCHECWDYWLKYGGLRQPNKWETPTPVSAAIEAIYKCSMCTKVFSRKERLAAHMREHQPYPCGVDGCTKSFKSKASVVRHRSSAHGIGEDGSRRDQWPSKPFIMRPLAVGVAARRHLGAAHLRHSSRRTDAPLPTDNLPITNGAFYPSIGRPKDWWKVQCRQSLEETVEWLSSVSSRCKAVRSPTIAPNYSGVKVLGPGGRTVPSASLSPTSSQLRLRNPTVRLTRPSTPPNAAVRSGSSTRAESLASAATVAAYVASQQARQTTPQGDGSQGDVVTTGQVEVVDLTSSPKCAQSEGNDEEVSASIPAVVPVKRAAVELSNGDEKSDGAPAKKQAKIEQVEVL